MNLRVGPFFFIFVFVFFSSLGEAAPIASIRDIEKLVNGKNASQIGTVEKFLNYIPESLQTLPQLIFESASAQYADTNSPRIIASVPDASLLMAFNGLKDSLGYDTVDFIQYQKNAYPKFEFYELEFPQEINSGLQPGDVPKTQAPFFQPFKATQARCLGCHYVTGGPLLTLSDYAGELLGSQVPMPAPYKANLDVFLKNVKAQPRYAQMWQLKALALKQNPEGDVEQNAQAFLESLRRLVQP